MKKKSSSSTRQSSLPVSKQTAGGVTGAVVGSVLGGPVGAVVGGIAGAIMGNRAAKGKPLVSSTTSRAAKNAVAAVKKKMPALKGSLPAWTDKGTKAKRKPLKAKAAAPPSPKSQTPKGTKTVARKRK